MSKVGLGGSLWSPVYRRSRCPRAGGEGSNRDISTTLCPTYRYYDISNHREDFLFISILSQEWWPLHKKRWSKPPSLFPQFNRNKDPIPVCAINKGFGLFTEGLEWSGGQLPKTDLVFDWRLLRVSVKVQPFLKEECGFIDTRLYCCPNWRIFVGRYFSSILEQQ